MSPREFREAIAAISDTRAEFGELMRRHGDPRSEGSLFGICFSYRPGKP